MRLCECGSLVGWRGQASALCRRASELVARLEINMFADIDYNRPFISILVDVGLRGIPAAELLYHIIRLSCRDKESEVQLPSSTASSTRYYHGHNSRFV
jgi:hypothetical protein